MLAMIFTGTKLKILLLGYLNSKPVAE